QRLHGRHRHVRDRVAYRRRSCCPARWYGRRLESDRRLRPIDDARLLEGRLGRGEAGNGDPERRARYVVHSGVMAELHGARLAAVLSADADLQILPRAAAEPHRQLDQLADAFLVEDLKRVLGQDTAVDVEGQETSGVVAR